MKKLIYTAIIATTLLFTFQSCKKDIYGCTDSSADNYSNKATEDDGSCYHAPEPETHDISTVEEYQMTFGPSTTFNTFSGFVDEYENGDIIINYAYWSEYGDKYWIALPISQDGIFIYDEIGDNGNVYINFTLENDTNSSPLSETTTFTFKSILIKGSFIKENPDIELENYKEVEKALNL